jgi:hypothetical protein
LSAKAYVYWWADGIYFNVRLDEERSCVLVLIGALEDGTKELLAVVDGYRESTQFWRELLGQLKRHGLTVAPKLAVGDGSLGFWLALQEEYGPVPQQRCWVHKTANILDKMPKSLQGRAKELIHEMYLSPTRKAALAAYDQFLASYQTKYPKATDCLEKDKEWLFTFYDFPARALVASANDQPDRIHLCHSAPSYPENQGMRLADRDTDDGLQARARSPETLAPAEWISPAPKSGHRRSIYRRRGVRTTSCLTVIINRMRLLPVHNF